MSFHKLGKNRCRTHVINSTCWVGICTIAGKKLTVITSIDRAEGMASVEHVSVSLPNRLPTWEEIKAIKNEFWDRGDEVYQVLPADKEYVNLHRYCLHLWRRVDGKSLMEV